MGEEVLGVFLRMVLGEASDEAIAEILRDGSLASSGMERTDSGFKGS